jgi:hypothetical protein
MLQITVRTYRLLDIFSFINSVNIYRYRGAIDLTVGLIIQRSRVQSSWEAEFFLSEISTVTPNTVRVRSVKNGKSHSPIDGISIAMKSAKGEIRVSENRTLGLWRWGMTGMYSCSTLYCFPNIFDVFENINLSSDRNRTVNHHYGLMMQTWISVINWLYTVIGHKYSVLTSKWHSFAYINNAIKTVPQMSLQ